MTAATDTPDTNSPRPTETGLSSAQPEPVVFKDVWTRSGSRYRVRAIALLAVNVLLFAGVGAFAFWLRNGVRFAPAQEGYWDELKQTFWTVPILGRAAGDASLGSLLLEPISVQDVPMQIPILGLLMAALIAVPILAAMLYRFWSCLPFIAVVGFLAVMPWLAITLFVSCMLAASRPFRTRFRFVSALLGLVPVVVYLILAWSGTTEAVLGRIDPVDRIKFVAPWVLAIVAAALVFATVLAIARVVDYRPGAIAPLLAIMFGLPVVLFEFHVGRDELYYRLLAARDHAHFADKNASVELEQAVMEEWLRHPHPRPSMKAVSETVGVRWLFELTDDVGHAHSALSRHQAELTTRCDWFLRRFPESRYAPNVLFIKARALDMRVDPAEFRRTNWIRFYDDFPASASRDSWRKLVANRPDSNLGAIGLLRLAQLDARNGDVERAADRLRTLLERFGTSARSGEAAPTNRGAFQQALARQTPEACLQLSVDRIVLQARCLHDLLAENRDPIYSYDPISGPRSQTDGFPFGLLELEPRHERYVQNLQALKAEYPNCQIEDNIDLEIARASTPIALKIERLESCLKRFPEGDAVPEALFRLGVAYKADGRIRAGNAAFARLFDQHPGSVWVQQATRNAPWRSAAFGSQRSAPLGTRHSG